MMISLLFHRYPSVPCQGCTVTNFRCLPAERDTTHPPTPFYNFDYPFISLCILSICCIGMAGNDAVKKHSSADNTCRYPSIIRLWPFHQVNASQCERAHTIHHTYTLTYTLTHTHIHSHTHTHTHTQTHTHMSYHLYEWVWLAYVPMMNHLMGISLTAKSN